MSELKSDFFFVGDLTWISELKDRDAWMMSTSLFVIGSNKLSDIFLDMQSDLGMRNDNQRLLLVAMRVISQF